MAAEARMSSRSSVMSSYLSTCRPPVGQEDSQSDRQSERQADRRACPPQLRDIAHLQEALAEVGHLLLHDPVEGDPLEPRDADDDHALRLEQLAPQAGASQRAVRVVRKMGRAVHLQHDGLAYGKNK
eukprot:6328956-Pyramimonas_sp.AAC.1